MNQIIKVEEKKQQSWLITEYDPKYCAMLCEYAYNHFDIDGFYGKYNISPIAASEWELQHEEWREAMMMANYKKKAGIAESMLQLLNFAKGSARKNPKTGELIFDRQPDIDLMQKVLFKMSDNNLRLEKDTGELKRQGLENAKKAKRQVANNPDSELAASIAKEILKGD